MRNKKSPWRFVNAHAQKSYELLYVGGLNLGLSLQKRKKVIRSKIITYINFEL